ncbi:hypothetical protein Cpir12675_000944 [Ceratocystis pirilliformis]|uniref:ORC6 first cyclin-like domain-containing protein n=1 Tax=Ceratocystis pirilliformis TaxID=259994 RepID=A0ABR3ZJR3_9PEZI
MPSHGPIIPPQLVDLAGSLVVQSRQRASTLKAEEEIARSYCCAHLACDRLKIALNLPPIEPRPPIPPRVYKRLYTHLDNVLPKTAMRVNATRARPTAPPTAPPLSRNRLAGAQPMAGRVPQKPSTASRLMGGSVESSTGKDRNTGVPKWMIPVARYMCVKAEQRFMAPSVFGGIDYIVAPGGKRTKDPWILTNLGAVVMAVFVLVVERGAALLHASRPKDAYTKGEGTNTTDNTDGAREYISPKMRKLAVELAIRARSEITSITEKSDWEGWSAPTARTLSQALERIQSEEEWINADWMGSVKDVVARILEANERVRSGRQKAAQSSGLVQRSDTMMQEKWEFLNEKRRREQRAWEETILMKISQLESSSGGLSMEVDN